VSYAYLTLLVCIHALSVQYLPGTQALEDLAPDSFGLDSKQRILISCKDCEIPMSLVSSTLSTGHTIIQRSRLFG
jgi:hypothetical protein